MKHFKYCHSLHFVIVKTGLQTGLVTISGSKVFHWLAKIQHSSTTALVAITLRLSAISRGCGEGRATECMCKCKNGRPRPNLGGSC